MKKLNRKGFTLIELLAVIVILAIIVVVTVPTIINTINDARKQSIWNLAGSLANSYDTTIAQDLLASSPAIPVANRATGTWACINDTIAKKLDISSADVNLTGTNGVSTSVPLTGAKIDVSKITNTTCSAIRTNGSGAAEVLLVATTTGKFNISGKVVYALSTGSGAEEVEPPKNTQTN